MFMVDITEDEEICIYIERLNNIQMKTHLKLKDTKLSIVELGVVS